MEELYLILDQGTSSSKAVLFDSGMNIVRHFLTPVRTITNERGFLEQSPKAILGSALRVLKSCIKSLGPNEKIISMGITNQRETFLLWNKESGNPVSNAILWEDRRTVSECELLKREYGTLIKERTGLVPDPYLSATKVQWVLKNASLSHARIMAGEILFGTVDSWLLWNLSGGKIHSTDHSNASRTMFFNIDRMEWDSDLLEIFRIPEELLPDVNHSSNFYGTTQESVLGIELPIESIIGDQQSSLIGHNLFHDGETKVTYGTGAFLLQNTGDSRIRTKRLLETVLYTSPGRRQFALEGSVLMAGKLLNLISHIYRVKSTDYNKLNPLKMLENPSPIIIPAFDGLGAPYWNSDITGSIFGLRNMKNTDSLLNSAMASIALRVNDVMEELESIERKPSRIYADGGLSKNANLLRFQSIISEVEICTNRNPQFTTAAGSASLAYLNHCGHMPSVSIDGGDALIIQYEGMRSKETGDIKRLWQKAMHLALQFSEAPKYEI